MIEAIIAWWQSLTMEQVFILTGIEILLVGGGLGFLGALLSSNENERNDENG